jgi:hypothetical protein
MATVQVGAREISVEQTPLPTRLRTHHPVTLSEPEHGRLELRTTRGVRVLGWVFCAFGFPVLLLGLLVTIGVILRPELEGASGMLLFLGLGFLFSWLGVLFVGPRYRFDTRTGELTIRYLGRTRRRPLAAIVAVQVINAGWFGNDLDGDGRFLSYQLNLVLDDPSEPRLFVAYNPDVADMGKKARQLAEFLNVPLLAAEMRGKDPRRKNAEA